jgi:hypothetical protein
MPILDYLVIINFCIRQRFRYFSKGQRFSYYRYQDGERASVNQGLASWSYGYFRVYIVGLGFFLVSLR